MVPALRPRHQAPGGGTGGRRAGGPGARSAGGTAGQASARRSPSLRSPSLRSPSLRSPSLRSPSLRSSGPRSPDPRLPGDRNQVHRSAGKGRPDSRAAARSGPVAGACASGPVDLGLTEAASPRGAAAAGHTRPRRHRPARSDPRRRRPGTRGVHPGVFAWASRRHRGPGRCRHVPPGTSRAGQPSPAAGHALPHECRSGEIRCRT
jgi:hypothetical protein